MADKKEKAFVERSWLDWSQMRRMGRRRLSLIIGSLVGGSVALGIILYPLILRGRFDPMKAMAISVLCLSLGWFFGFKLWDETEKKFLADDQPVNPLAPTPDATSNSDRPPER